MVLDEWKGDLDPTRTKEKILLQLEIEILPNRQKILLELEIEILRKILL